MKWRPLRCLPLKLTVCLSLFCVHVGEIYKCQVFFSVFVFVFQQREVLCLLLYSPFTMWTPREALSVATCSVNKCDYIYFVHSYDDRRMIGRLDPGWADDVTLALKTLVFLSPDYNQLNLDLLTVCHV